MSETSEEDLSSSSDTSIKNDTTRRKRKQFSVQEKKQILDEIDKGVKKGIIAKKYHISSSTLSTFLKYREKIEKSSFSPFVDPYRKRVYATQLSKVGKISKSNSQDNKEECCDSSSRSLSSGNEYQEDSSTTPQHSTSDGKESIPSDSERLEDFKGEEQRRVPVDNSNSPPQCHATKGKELIQYDSSASYSSKGGKKRQQFSLEEKKVILKELDKGTDPKQVARQFGINGSTLFSFMRSKKKIEDNIVNYECRPKVKRLRPSPYEAIDKAVYDWILQSKSKKFPVNDTLRNLARSFADSLGIKNFKGSVGWLYRFKYHYGIWNDIEREKSQKSSDKILRSKKPKDSEVCASNNIQNKYKTAECTKNYQNDDELENNDLRKKFKIRFKQKREKNKTQKNFKTLTKTNILVNDCKNISPTTQHSESRNQTLNDNVKTNIIQNLESGKSTNSRTCCESFQVNKLINSSNYVTQIEAVSYNIRNIETSRCSLDIAEDDHNVKKKEVCYIVNNSDDDLSISQIVSASDAVIMACKLRQFIMAHKDIPNYVQDSCDIICDYTERCVQQEKTKDIV